MKKEAQPLELGDEEIDVHTNYDMDNPLTVEDPDPAMRYYFAANDGDNSRPDGVARVKARGYQVSKKAHGSTDCTLMEIPKAAWERRRAAMLRARQESLGEAERGLARRIESEGGRSIRLKKDGGYEE